MKKKDKIFNDNGDIFLKFFKEHYQSFFNFDLIIQSFNYSIDPSININKNNEDIVDITYQYNNYGYRSEDFVKNKPADLLTLGCSHTYGYGLPIEKTWPSLLSQDLNVTMHNLGVSGDSAIGQVHRAFWYFENVGVPKKIAALLPLQRMILALDSKNNKSLVSDNKNIGISKSFFEKSMLKKYSKLPHKIEEVVSPETSVLYSFLAISILQSFCKINNVEFVFYFYEGSFIKDFFDLSKKNFFNNFYDLKLNHWKEDNDKLLYFNNNKIILCHKEYEKDTLFHFAADRKNGKPHWGFHKHLHIAENFLEYFNNKKE